MQLLQRFRREEEKIARLNHLQKIDTFMADLEADPTVSNHPIRHKAVLSAFKRSERWRSKRYAVEFLFLLEINELCYKALIAAKVVTA